MNFEEYVKTSEIKKNLKALGFDESVEKGRLMLVELLVKAGAGVDNSHTEEKYLQEFQLTKKDRTPNKKGLKFLCSMIYSYSHTKPEVFSLMDRFRR